MRPMNGTRRNISAMDMAHREIRWHDIDSNPIAYAVRMPFAVWTAICRAIWDDRPKAAEACPPIYSMSGDLPAVWVRFDDRTEADRVIIVALAALAFFGVRTNRALTDGEPFGTYFAQWAIDKTPRHPSGPPWMRATEVLGEILRHTKALKAKLDEDAAHA